jgi:chromosome segregation ATPase
LKLFSSLYNEFTLFDFSVVKEKEVFAKELAQVENMFNLRHQEHSNVDAMNTELEAKLARLAQELKTLTERKEQQEKRTSHLKEIERDIEQEREVKEQAIVAKVEAEERLDSINAEIATLSLVKRVLENKLERVAEDKGMRIKEKQHMHSVAEEERNAYVAQIQHLLRHKETQQEIHKSTTSKLDSLKAENEALESQLEKAKNQVTQLIQQIGKFDAKAARELKAEKMAKETGKTRQ